MGKVLAGIATSVDGFITRPGDGPGCGLGVGGERLHHWVFGVPVRIVSPAANEQIGLGSGREIGCKSWDPLVRRGGDGNSVGVQYADHAKLAEVGPQDCSSADEFGQPARSSFQDVRAWRTG